MHRERGKWILYYFWKCHEQIRFSCELVIARAAKPNGKLNRIEVMSDLKWPENRIRSLEFHWIVLNSYMLLSNVAISVGSGSIENGRNLMSKQARCGWFDQMWIVRSNKIYAMLFIVRPLLSISSNLYIAIRIVCVRRFVNLIDLFKQFCN